MQYSLVKSLIKNLSLFGKDIKIIPITLESKEFYRKQLTANEFNYLLNNSIHKTDQFSSYKTLIESKVVIGVSTTMLREKLSLFKGKILTCNYTNLPLFNFPKDGIFVLKKV